MLNVEWWHLGNRLFNQMPGYSPLETLTKRAVILASGNTCSHQPDKATSHTIDIHKCSGETLIYLTTLFKRWQEVIEEEVIPYVHSSDYFLPSPEHGNIALIQQTATFQEHSVSLGQERLNCLCCLTPDHAHG